MKKIFLLLLLALCFSGFDLHRYKKEKEAFIATVSSLENSSKYGIQACASFENDEHDQKRSFTKTIQKKKKIRGLKPFMFCLVNERCLKQDYSPFDHRPAKNADHFSFSYLSGCKRGPPAVL
ncbi:MAG: hypothetical protein ACJ76F_02700 [Bacteroidia bacterium]